MPLTDEARVAVLLLADARHARSRADMAEGAIRSALAIAPGDVDVQLAAYRFYFFNHRLADAMEHAAEIVKLIVRSLNIAADWRLVEAEDAAFGELETTPGLYLQALLAWGYCKVRRGAQADGRLALAKVSELDTRDRFGAKRLLAVIDAAAEIDDLADAR